MFKALFNIIINMLATVVQIVMLPINAVLVAVLPDFSTWITQITSVFSTVFDSMAWALSILPPGVLPVLIFIVVCEIAKHTIFVNTHNVTKIWNLFQKLKFW